jgi:FMN phosphatase YigB (HAD superfamily)
VQTGPRDLYWIGKLAGVEPHEIFYTDDIPGLIAGAKAAGYDAVPFTSVREYVRELTARGH